MAEGFLTEILSEICIIFSNFSQVQTDYGLQTESDAYEPTVQFAQVGSKNYTK